MQNPAATIELMEEVEQITIRIGGAIQRIQQNKLIERIEHVQLI